MISLWCILFLDGKERLKIAVLSSLTQQIFFFSFFFLGPHVWHVEVPRLGVESELQLLPYTTATATRDPSHACDLHCSSRQCQILNQLSKTQDRTCILLDASWIHFHCATNRKPCNRFSVNSSFVQSTSMPRRM